MYSDTHQVSQRAVYLTDGLKTGLQQESVELPLFILNYFLFGLLFFSPTPNDLSNSTNQAEVQQRIHVDPADPWRFILLHRQGTTIQKNDRREKEIITYY
jgi:hypothetical protein